MQAPLVIAPMSVAAPVAGLIVYRLEALQVVPEAYKIPVADPVSPVQLSPVAGVDAPTKVRAAEVVLNVTSCLVVLSNA